MSELRSMVENVVNCIPKGRVTSYGAIALYCGQPRAARQVGQIAHFGNPSLPWHRVIRKDGGLARAYPGGMRAQQAALEAEGVKVEGFVVVQLEDAAWLP